MANKKDSHGAQKIKKHDVKLQAMEIAEFLLELHRYRTEKLSDNQCVLEEDPTNA